MPATNQVILLAADMIRTRDTLHRRYGERYEALTADARAAVRRAMDQDNVSAAKAGLTVCLKLVADGHPDAVGVVVAAVVDLCEERPGLEGEP